MASTSYAPLEIEFEFRTTRYKQAAVGLKLLAVDLEKDFRLTSPVLRKSLKNYLDTVAFALADRHKTAWPSGTTDNTLSKRSGKGMRSIKQSIKVSGQSLDDIQGVIGGDFYLRIQETGGTIRAKKVKFLTIPLKAALNSRGIPKKMSAREWDRTFVARSKAGNLIIFTTKGRKLIPLYVLKKQVYIPPRLGMQKTINAGLQRFVDTTMDAMIKKILDVKGK